MTDKSQNRLKVEGDEREAKLYYVKLFESRYAVLHRRRDK